ncbi:CBN-ACDH-13 protein [Caenorhabditis brenneri]|uniref:CBN-ACDH-13 protein n=1 Tax=Caenorhabditis brenneri TaxID=135651 RepID=G0P9W4_CAEBE|nr:CBN-ACDH-13 protein [Caenorhabditis brenneri]
MHRAIFRLQKLPKYTVRSLSNAVKPEKPEKSAEISEKSKYAIRTLDNSAPIEKRSLSRGFAMNKFEKDFMIYPEYTDSDDLRNIDGFVDVLRKSLELSVDLKQIEKDGNLSPEILETLRSNAIFSCSIGKPFGGIQMYQKDISKVFEELSIDFNVFSTAHISLIVSNLLTIYGSDEQKSKYLKLISEGKLRPSIAIVKDTNGGRVEMTQGPSGKSMIEGQNLRVIGHHNANFYVVFANNAGSQTCFLLDESELGTTDTIKFQRDETIGLKGIDIGRVELTALVSDKHVLGQTGGGAEIAAEMSGSGRMPFAAATVGMAKRALRELSLWCNRTPSRRTDRSTLADDTRSQRIVTDLALKVYALESSLYYLSGLIDEGLSIVVDIENSLISMLTRDVLQSIISCQLELVGVASSDSAFPHEKIFRDITTLLATLDESPDIEQIGLATIATWATSTSHKRIVSTLKRWLKQEKEADEMRNPGLTHYIAEHAHPSLQMACQELEFSMSRINNVVSKLMTSQGKNIEQDYGSLEALVTVLKNNLVMVATISRASRSYSIGLRNADIELAWATIICSRLSRASWFELDALSDLFGLVRFNPSLLNAGRAVFDLGGYIIESPLEKNW